jgi:hypothetical protein
MANPFDNILSSQLLDTYDQMIQGVINSLKVPCTLVYPITKWVDCNCPTSVFNNSPNPFIQGKLKTACPTCGGNQKVESETTESINLCLILDYKSFQKIANTTITSQGDARTLSEISEAQKIKNCKYIIFDTDKEYFKTRKFKLSGEPTPMGFRNNFYLATWEAV